MKVYIVMEDNGEDYEDYREYVKGAYSSRRKAVEAIKADGYEWSGSAWRLVFEDEYYDGSLTVFHSWIIERELDK